MMTLSWYLRFRHMEVQHEGERKHTRMKTPDLRQQIGRQRQTKEPADQVADE